MGSKSPYRLTLRAVFLIFILAGAIHNASGQQSIMIIDTTDYLPYPEGINTNLMIAAAEGYTSEVHRLIKLGADVDATDLENITALIYAVANRNLNTVKALLEYNPDINILTRDSESALHIAAKDNLVEIAEELIRNGANINLEDKHGATPLHYASTYGNFFMCDLLIYYNAALESRSDDGSTPLMAAVFSRHADVSDLLLQSGASPDTPDNDGFTPLIVAAQNNDTLLMSLLLTKGADIHATNKFMYDALGMAIRNNNAESFDFLIDKVDQDRYGRNKGIISPVIIARKYGRSQILKELDNAGFSDPASLSFDHVKINAGIKTAIRDYYTRLGISIKNPRFKIMINAGFDLKPTYNRVLVEESPDNFFQYYDKRYIIYAGAGKAFSLRQDNARGELSLDIHLNIGYMFTSQYRGTYINPPDKIKIMPQVLLRWKKGKLNIYGGYEFMSTDLYRIGPSWFALGVSYDIYFDKMRSPQKNIRWN